MAGVVVNGQLEQIPGLVVDNYLGSPWARLPPEDVRPRHTRWIQQVVLHTTKGIPGGKDQRRQVILDGLGPSKQAAQRCIRAWTENPEPAGAHLVVDFDGRVTAMCDLLTEAAQHGRHTNQTSIGIEIYQGSDAEMYLGQLEVVVALVDWLTLRFGIQRQIPVGPFVGPSHRLINGVDDVVGILGHRDFDHRRGKGDPGSKIFYMLGAAGYEPVNFDLNEDRDTWRRRQRDISPQLKADGIPGPATVAALRAAASVAGLDGRRPGGLWVLRPGDPTG